MILVDSKAALIKVEYWTIAVQHVPQGLQLRDELVDLLHRGRSRPLQHGVDAVGQQILGSNFASDARWEAAGVSTLLERLRP